MSRINDVPTNDVSTNTYVNTLDQNPIKDNNRSLIHKLVVKFLVYFGMGYNRLSVNDQKDKEFLLELVKTNYNIYDTFPHELKKDANVINSIFKSILVSEKSLNSVTK